MSALFLSGAAFLPCGALFPPSASFHWWCCLPPTSLGWSCFPPLLLWVVLFSPPPGGAALPSRVSLPSCSSSFWVLSPSFFGWCCLTPPKEGGGQAAPPKGRRGKAAPLSHFTLIFLHCTVIESTLFSLMYANLFS